jgi:hypothetical protein
MTINEIIINSGMKSDVSESLYWKSLWLRMTPADTKINWFLILKDEHYRRTGEIKNEKKRV